MSRTGAGCGFYLSAGLGLTAGGACSRAREKGKKGGVSFLSSHMARSRVRFCRFSPSPLFFAAGLAFASRAARSSSVRPDDRYSRLGERLLLNSVSFFVTCVTARLFFSLLFALPLFLFAPVRFGPHLSQRRAQRRRRGSTACADSDCKAADDLLRALGRLGRGRSRSHTTGKGEGAGQWADGWERGGAECTQGAQETERQEKAQANDRQVARNK